MTQFLEQLQLHTGIARSRESAPHAARPLVFFLENLLTDLFANKPEEGADFLDVLTGRVDCGGFLAIRYLADLAERACELLPRDSTDARRDWLICLQTITHNETID